ncbi:hypothetical protein KL928_002422 [Ogataea angusta]|uniref:Uncharacterized protein n=1 Tax=Pichia angusta TaxID=870730 RepID=A0AAN6DGX7_PICAN|nr:uncharacterized protein KL928_002422 [Ogataea angusta]KAG7819748.1 hypothetical protein KL928_002422 [Ogataea angusta]
MPSARTVPDEMHKPVREAARVRPSVSPGVPRPERVQRVDSVPGAGHRPLRLQTALAHCSVLVEHGAVGVRRGVRIGTAKQTATERAHRHGRRVDGRRHRVAVPASRKNLYTVRSVSVLAAKSVVREHRADSAEARFARARQTDVPFPSDEKAAAEIHPRAGRSVQALQREPGPGAQEERFCETPGQLETAEDRAQGGLVLVKDPFMGMTAEKLAAELPEELSVKWLMDSFVIYGDFDESQLRALKPEVKEVLTSKNLAMDCALAKTDIPRTLIYDVEQSTYQPAETKLEPEPNRLLISTSFDWY